MDNYRVNKIHGPRGNSRLKRLHGMILGYNSTHLVVRVIVLIAGGAHPFGK